jgi:hypothetical protein
MARKIVTEIVTDILTWVSKLTLLTASVRVESTSYVLSTRGECIRPTDLPAICNFVLRHLRKIGELLATQGIEWFCWSNIGAAQGWLGTHKRNRSDDLD